VQTGDSGLPILLKRQKIFIFCRFNKIGPRNDRFSGCKLLSFRGKPENGCFPVLTRNPAAAKLFDLLSLSCRIGSFIPEGFHIAAENILFARKGYGPVTVIAWRGEGYAEPVYLVTNMKPPEDAADYYSGRFRIETFFLTKKAGAFISIKAAFPTLNA
jgi:hypothetical protein